MTNDLDLFADRIVTIYVSLDGTHGKGMVMQRCSVRQIGQREFVFGTPVDVGHGGQDRWTVGVETAIACDRVVSMHFMTLAQYEEQLKRRGHA